MGANEYYLLVHSAFGQSSPTAPYTLTLTIHATPEGAPAPAVAPIQRPRENVEIPTNTSIDTSRVLRRDALWVCSGDLEINGARHDDTDPTTGLLIDVPSDMASVTLGGPHGASCRGGDPNAADEQVLIDEKLATQLQSRCEGNRGCARVRIIWLDQSGKPSREDWRSPEGGMPQSIGASQPPREPFDVIIREPSARTRHRTRDTRQRRTYAALERCQVSGPRAAGV